MARHGRRLFRHWSNVAGCRTNQPARAALLLDVREPTGTAPDGEHGAEEGTRNTQSVQEQRGVKFDVGPERAVRMTLGQERFGRVLDTACLTQTR